VCAKDATALNVRQELAAMRLCAPRNCALAGLTTIRSERALVGQIGVRLLQSLISEPAIGWQHVVLRPAIEVRSSTAPPATDREGWRP
jgi:DNA-binding LacI/PurR family transcriptional regulator